MRAQPSPGATLLGTLRQAFSNLYSTRPDGRLLVAFSGGPDSTALLWGLAELRTELGLKLFAAHLDHRLDPGSAQRAEQARVLAGRLQVPFLLGRVSTQALPEKGTETWAREHRYAFLSRAARHLSASLIATAHHRDDQAETVLLRLLFGSGLEGLAGIPQRRGKIIRPLLPLWRRDLDEALEEVGLEAVDDPSNRDLDVPRSLVRQRLLPRLEAEDPAIRQRLCTLSSAASEARARIEARLAPYLSPRLHPEGGLELALEALSGLPEPLLPHALAYLHRRAGAHYPPPVEARRELERQLKSSGNLGCDCGDGWRWESRDGRFLLLPTAGKVSVLDFSHQLRLPGSVDIPEIGRRLTITRTALAPWMLQGRPWRTGLALPLRPGDSVLVRNRRPGDRIRPLGGQGSKKLKALLIDHRVPRQERDTLPLLWVGDTLAWVPGLTIHHEYRIRGEKEIWLAEISPLEGAKGAPGR